MSVDPFTAAARPAKLHAMSGSSDGLTGMAALLQRMVSAKERELATTHQGGECPLL